ncbi:thermonuclease family protein [Cyanobium sp. LEGE 06143]|nr:thermonuclease family protein [Cyanobium sp. LEGE 06143]
MLGSGPVEIRPQTVDRYGRTVAEVYAGGRNVNVEMVRVGAGVSKAASCLNLVIEQDCSIESCVR